MNYLTQILFFFGAIGAFNSFILAVYLLFSKSYSRLRHRVFGLFLLILSLRVIKSLFYAFSTDEPIWFLQSGPSFFLLIGPLLFTYIIYIINPQSFWVKSKIQHLTFWLFIVVSLLVFLPFNKYNELNKNTLLPIINFQWFLYIVFSAFFIKQNLERGKQLTIQNKWLLILLATNSIIWLCFALIEFNYFVTGSIIYSLLFYLLFLFFLFNKKISSIIFEKNKVIKNARVSKESERIVDELKILISTEKPYLNPDLKIADVAQKLNISSHELSKLINENLNCNFTEFINKYRIEEAKQLIVTNSNYTIEAIGNQSGFNSKSAFYKAFKIHTGTTPAKFKT